MEKLVIATKNQHKLQEFKRILEPLGFEVISQTEAGIEESPEETGTTFEENSAIKARAIYNKCKLAVISDDSGIEADALDKQPGVYSARYGGEGLDDVDRYKLLLKNMENKENRTARYVCVITYIDKSGKETSFRGEWEGTIGFKAIGENGFGYDPIFMVGEKSSAQLSSEEKDKLSHRGKASRMLVEYIKNKKGTVL